MGCHAKCWPFCLLVWSLLLIVGCGTNGSSPLPESPGGTLTLSATSFDFGTDIIGSTIAKTVAIVTNTGSVPVQLNPTITGDPSYAIVSAGGCGTSLPVGGSCNLQVSYTPTAASAAANQTAILNLGATNVMPTSTYAVSLTGRSTPPAGMLSLSSTSFDFGGNLVNNSITKTVAIVTNTGSVAIQLSPSLTGNASYSLVSAGGCGASLPVAASCNLLVNYSPTIASAPAAQTATLNLGATNVQPPSPYTVSLTGISGTISGTVSSSSNPMVALYSLTLPFPGTWSVAFGKDTNYGLSTGTVSSSVNGATTSVLVAGMLPNTVYHLSANVTLSNGIKATDADHTFNVGALPPGIPATLPAITTPGLTPQPGVELVNTVIGAISTGALATDLQGNVIWAYPFPGRGGSALLYPIRLLPNGHFLCMIAASYPTLPSGTDLNVIREFDLAGNTIQELTMADLNARLAAHGFVLTLNAFSHDIVVLPNGHYLAIANTIKSFTDLPGYPGVTQVGGDTVVDLDPTFQPVWVWNSFDHLDINRHPYMFPDWTHANSVAYSKDDGNFIISLRHQNWVLKIDYQDGAGSGDILWHLGEGGDFTLKGGTDPTDWFYSQHHAEFASSNTTGVFSMTLFDNGDDRMFPNGTTCGPLPGQIPCLYSTVPELQIDEAAKTATFQFHQILPANLYSYFAGNTEILPNGNFEYDLAGVGTSSYVFEVIPGATIADTPQTVWELQVPGTNTYRAFRLPSLYPGVQW